MAVPTNGPAGDYGYFWWLETLGGYAAYRAWGYGKQFIYVIPALDLVVVISSDTNSDATSDNNLNFIVED